LGCIALQTRLKFISFVSGFELVPISQCHFLEKGAGRGSGF